MLPIYNDVYIEDVTHRKTTVLAKATYVVSVVMAVLLFILGFVDRGAFFVCFLFAGLAFFCKWSGDRDYEINYTNGTLDVDAIMGKSRRKSIISIEVDDIVVMAPSKTDPVKPYIGRSMVTHDCISHEPEVKYYCMIYKNKDTKREEKLLFEPSEQLIDELKRRAPGRIHQ